MKKFGRQKVVDCLLQDLQVKLDGIGSKTCEYFFLATVNTHTHMMSTYGIFQRG